MIYLKILIITFALFFLISPELQADSKQQLQEISKSIRVRDYSKAVKQLKPLVKSGDTEAQFLLAGLYRSGKGVKKDLDKAMKLYEKAANNGHVDAQYTLASILEKKGDITKALFWYQQASEQGHRKALKKLKVVQKASESFGNEDISADTVFSSIVHNDIKLIQSCVENGYNFNIQDKSSRTPLIAALLAENKKIADLLLPVTRNLAHNDQNMNQAIHVAASNGYADIVKKLLDKKVDINAQDNLGNTPLLIAVRHDDAKVTRLLLQNNADYRLQNKRKVSAIELAQTRADADVLKVFASQGIKVGKNQDQYDNVSIEDFKKSIKESSSIYKGWPILSIACLLGENDIVRQLLKQGAEVNARDSDGFSALHRASSKEQVKTVGLLLKSGALINIQNDKKETPLFLAAEAGSYKMVKLLLSKGADPTILSSKKKSALAVAISNQHKDVALLLADKKLDKVSIHAALFLSIQKDMKEVGIKLVKRDTLINDVDDNKRSVLWFSADKGLEKTTAALMLNKSLDVDQKDVKGYSPLARSILKGHSVISKLLIGVGADINTQTAEKNTLLMLAVLSGKQEMVRLLINKKINIDAKNNSGETALMLAAGMGNNDLVEILIEAGADILTRNQDELGAYEIALKAGKKDTAELIRNKSGSIFKLFN
jgi:ankyrin repeat protein